MTLFLHLLRRAALAFAGALVGLVLTFLLVDLAENAAMLRGPGWLPAAAALYGCRAALAAWQVAPAAVLLAAALTVSGLRRTREYTALRALGLGPWRAAAPVLALAAAVAAALAWAGDALVVDAAARADAILAERFHRGPALGLQRPLERWFRGAGGRRIYRLAGSGEGGAYDRATILEVGEDFRLLRRIDAGRMVPLPGGQGWELAEVEERTFDAEGRLSLATFPRRTYRFEEAPGSFDARPGRPAQLRRAALSEQRALRERLGLPTRELALAWHERLAAPLACVPAALVAVGLALRRRRRGHFTASLVEAVAVSLAFAGVHGACVALGLAGRLAPALAAWLPDGLLALAGLAGSRRWG